MPIPIIPILNGTFEDSASYNSRRVFIQFEQSQAEDFAKDGINDLLHNYKIQEYIIGKDNKDILNNFLLERRGIKPFFFTPYSDNTKIGTKYICSKWDFTHISGQNDTVEVYRFTGEFQQVFRLKN